MGMPTAITCGGPPWNCDGASATMTSGALFVLSMPLTFMIAFAFSIDMLDDIGGNSALADDMVEGDCTYIWDEKLCASVSYDFPIYDVAVDSVMNSMMQTAMLTVVRMVRVFLCHIFFIAISNIFTPQSSSMSLLIEPYLLLELPMPSSSTNCGYIIMLPRYWPNCSLNPGLFSETISIIFQIQMELLTLLQRIV